MSNTSTVVAKKAYAFILNFMIKLTYKNGSGEWLAEWNLDTHPGVLASLGVLCAYINAKKLSNGISNFG